LLPKSVPWRPAREVIDWSLPSWSIFERKKELVPNTLARIEAGLRRFGGQPFVLQQQSCGAPRLTSEPLPTIATAGAVSLVEPFLVPFYGAKRGEKPRAHSLDDPIPTVTTENRFGLVEPFIVVNNANNLPKSLDDPLPTVTGGNRHYLVEPFTMPYCSNGGALARPVSQPLGTVTARDRFALVIPDGMDIRFRMLQPHELAASMGFPAGYQFSGTKTDVVRQIGNAWACQTATALCRVILSGMLGRESESRIRKVS
jgi:DNA (cytosine-5)-methyltransferase 1